MTQIPDSLAIESLYASWVVAFERGDVDEVLSLLTPDYTLWSPGAPPLTGRETLREPLVAAFALYDVSPSFELEERIVSGDMAVDVGWDVQAVRPKDGSPERIQRQRVMLVLTRDGEGAWRFARGLSQQGPST